MNEQGTSNRRQKHSNKRFGGVNVAKQRVKVNAKIMLDMVANGGKVNPIGWNYYPKNGHNIQQRKAAQKRRNIKLHPAGV